MESDISINGSFQIGTMQGWQCPVCNAVNSPWLQQCPCNGFVRETISAGTWMQCGNCGQYHQMGEACLNCSGFFSVRIY